MDLALLRLAALLAVAVAAAETEERASGVTSVTSHVKKREVALLDNTAVESGLRRGPVQYYVRRASRQRPYSVIKRKRRPISKGKSRPKKQLRTPHKYSPHKKHGKNTYSKRWPPKTYRKPPPTQNRRPSRYPTSRPPVPFVPQEPVGFGEPPADRYPDNMAHRFTDNTADRFPDKTPHRFTDNTADRFPENSFGQSYAEPPIDSYGNPLRTRPLNFNQGDFNDYHPNYQSNFPPNDHEIRPSNIHNVYDEHSYESDSSQNTASNYAEEHDIGISGSQRRPYKNAYAGNEVKTVPHHVPHNSYSDNIYTNDEDKRVSNHQTFNSFLENADTDDDEKIFQDHRPHNTFSGSAYKDDDEKRLANHRPYSTYSDNEDIRPAANKPHKHYSDEEEIRPTTHKHKQTHHSNHNGYKGQVSKPSRVARPKRPKQSDEIIVGGQYAEPPARYAQKFKPSTPLFEGDDPFVPGDSEGSASSQHASYVNYKNSNMAFSPQNLNDAFSVTDFTT